MIYNNKFTTIITYRLDLKGSFIVNVISNLLKVTSIHNTADIIGHKDLRSTMAYRRYELSKDEIQNLLESINEK